MKTLKYIKNYSTSWKAVLKVKNGWGLNKSQVIDIAKDYDCITEFLPNVTHTNLGKAFSYAGKDPVKDGTGQYFFVEEENYRYEFIVEKLNIEALKQFVEAISYAQDTKEVDLEITPIINYPTNKNLTPMKIKFNIKSDGKTQTFVYKGNWVPDYSSGKLMLME